jgi:PAS domain S-box-containing protein
MASHPFGDHIRQKRLALRARDARYSLRALAARLGIPVSTLSRLERGAVPRLSEERVQALAAELDENPDVLLALAGKIPSDVRDILLQRPRVFAALVRGLAGWGDRDVNASFDVPTLLASFRETQRLARVGSFSRDLVTGENFWSEEFCRIYGLPPATPTPDLDQFLSLLHPDDRAAVMAVREKLLAGEGPLRYAYRFRRADGLWRHAKAVARAEVDAEGRTVRLHGTVQDVTTERQALENLRSMARFPEDNPNPVLRVTGEDILAYANKASRPLLNGLGLDVGQPVPPRLGDLLARARAAGERLETEIALDEDGSWMSLTVAPLPFSGEVNLYGRDITAHRAAGQALAALEARHQRLCDDMPLGFFRATLSGRLLSVNPAMARLFGHASPEAMLAAVGDRAGKLYQDGQRQREIAHRLVNEEPGLLHFENAYQRRDGTLFLGNLHVRLVADAAGEPVVEGFVEESTARRRVESELAASEERLRTQLRNFPLPTLTFRLVGRELVFSDANKAAEALFRGRLCPCQGAPAGTLFDDAPEIYLALWSALESRLPEKRRLELRPPGAARPVLYDMTFVFAPPDTVMLHIQEIPG